MNLTERDGRILREIARRGAMITAAIRAAFFPTDKTDRRTRKRLGEMRRAGLLRQETVLAGERWARHATSRWTLTPEAVALLERVGRVCVTVERDSVTAAHASGGDHGDVLRTIGGLRERAEAGRWQAQREEAARAKARSLVTDCLGARECVFSWDASALLAEVYRASLDDPDVLRSEWERVTGLPVAEVDLYHKNDWILYLQGREG